MDTNSFLNTFMVGNLYIGLYCCDIKDKKAVLLPRNSSIQSLYGVLFVLHNQSVFSIKICRLSSLLFWRRGKVFIPVIPFLVNCGPQRVVIGSGYTCNSLPITYRLKIRKLQVFYNFLLYSLIIYLSAVTLYLLSK
jgi:hypothetical protein